ncbi:AHH domain-containing protein [Corallococcus coralloides]|nr:AHH domain-containing protein [Corallococcus coralloides]
MTTRGCFKDRDGLTAGQPHHTRPLPAATGLGPNGRTRNPSIPDERWLADTPRPGGTSSSSPSAPRNGGPWTPICEEIFEKAGMSLEDVANKVRLKGHEGPHTEAYHRAVVGRLQDAVSRCKTPEVCRTELLKELAKIANDLLTPGSKLRNRIVKAGD